MKWEEFIENNKYYPTGDWALTNIDCPNCGKSIYRYTKIVFTSMPPKHKYKCLNCQWEGIA